jgi:hypothetical protein
MAGNARPTLNNNAMVDDQTIQDLCRRIVQDFQPERIILFGSYAYGNPTPDSDVDLLVVLTFEGKNFLKSLEILNRANPNISYRPLGPAAGRHGAPLPGRRSPDSRYPGAW